MKTASQIFVIVLSISIVFIIVNTALVDYISWFLGVLCLVTIAYILFKRKRKSGEELFVGSHKEFFVITTGILLILFLTGGFESSFFFLVYFLLFGLSFMFEPITVFVLTISLSILFFPQALEGNIIVNMIRLGSLILLSPIAFFFGSEFKKRERLQQEVKKTAEDIKNQAHNLQKKTGLKKTQEALKQIEEEADKLKKDANT